MWHAASSGSSQRSPNVQRLGYVPALDGLRGIAILAVLGYHFFGLRAGFFGVDLFFVLSGFLITMLLLEEHSSSGAISFRRFYERRARRLLPALGTVLLFSLLVAALNLDAGQREYAWIRLKAIAACAFYAGNIVRALGHQLPIEVSPTWSLAQEEQFYIVWPVLLLAFLRFRARPAHLVAAFVSLATVVMAWRGFLTWRDGANDRVFFGPDTHCDGLALGAALAAARFAGLTRWLRFRASAVVLPALAGFAVLVAIVPAGRSADMLGLPAAELLGLALIAGATGDGRQLLAWSPLVWFGSISYGLYLWQGPVLLLFGHGILAASVAVGLGLASTHLIEAPFRRRRNAGVAPAAASCATATTG